MLGKFPYKKQGQEEARPGKSVPVNSNHPYGKTVGQGRPGKSTSTSSNWPYHSGDSAKKRSK